MSIVLSFHEFVRTDSFYGFEDSFSFSYRAKKMCQSRWLLSENENTYKEKEKLYIDILSFQFILYAYVFNCVLDKKCEYENEKLLRDRMYFITKIVCNSFACIDFRFLQQDMTHTTKVNEE